MKKIAIIGAGISGLFFANLLKNNLNYDFTIFEKKTSLNLEDGYGIQLSANSIKLLNLWNPPVLINISGSGISPKYIFFLIIFKSSFSILFLIKLSI